MKIGVVAIGRNEGDRLRACLASARRDCAVVVYVDSGSTDGSVALAQSLGVHVVDLDLSKPFTAARARNEGFAKLRQIDPSIEAVQFVDGDCEIVEGWIFKAAEQLQSIPKAAVICGRRRERFPDATVYNKLCDIEWDTPLGLAKACGGDALMRVSAFEQVAGYNSAVIAGEEPEMCVRLRQRNWTIHRIDAEMTLHDAAITHFTQWWKRSLRSGHAYAQGNALHRPPEKNRKNRDGDGLFSKTGTGTVYSKFNRDGDGLLSSALDGVESFGFREREMQSIQRWVIIPLALCFAAMAAIAFVAPRYCILGLIPILLYFAQAVRVTLQRYRRGVGFSDAAVYGAFLVLGKFPQWIGIRRFRSAHRRGERSTIIEYKGPTGSP